MLEKKTLITLLTVNTIIIGLIVYFFVFQKHTPPSDIPQDILIKNISWDTPFSESIPYKKNENIEFNILFSGEWKNKITLDTSKINKLFDIKKILIDEKETSPDNIILEEWNIITIITEAKDDGMVKKDEYQDIIVDTQKVEDMEIVEENNLFSWNKHISFSQLEANSNINQLIEVHWEAKDFIKYVNIGGVSFTPIYENNRVFLSITKNTFSSGEYFIVIQWKDNEIMSLSEKIKFTLNTSPTNIANITPASIKNDTDSYVVLQWNGFSKIISVQLSNNIILKTTAFHVINDHVMSVLIPKNLEPGNYYFNIMTPDGISELPHNTFLITH